MRESSRDRGFTLIELTFTMVLGGILMAIAVWAMHGYLVASREQGTATSIRSALRNAAERSVSEGRTYCVYLTASQWTLYKSDCTVASNKANGPFTVSDSTISVTNVSFPAPATPVPNQNTACPSAGACAYFYPRGTALAGSLKVARDNNANKLYTISVEGLTGRVSMG